MTTTSSSATYIDELVQQLADGEKIWGTLGLDDRADLLAALVEAVSDHAQEWIDRAREIKQLPADSPLIGEEWLSGPYALIAGAQTLRQSLAALAAGRSPVDGYRMTAAPGGRTAIRVLPHNIFDRLLLGGFTADVWCRSGESADSIRRRAGLGH